jgi:hypothetical protein
MATTIGTGIGQHLLSVIAGHSSSKVPPRPPSGPPVKVDAISLERDGSQGGIYVLPQKLVLSALRLRALSHIDSSQPAYGTWFTSRGGVDPSMSSVKLVVEGNRSHRVQIIGMRAIKHCQKPLNGTLFYSPPAGASLNIGIGFNLDNVAPIAENYSNYRIYGDYFATHTISLSHGEVLTLQVVSLTTKQYCQYTLQLTVVDGSKQSTETLTNDGRPFSVTGIPASKGNVRFSYYRALYVGGVAPRPCNCGWKRENPAYYSKWLRHSLSHLG